MATNAASPYRRRRTHASTTAAAIAVTTTGPPGQTSTASSAGCPPRAASTLASTAVSTQPVSIPCLSQAPCTAVTRTQVATIATARGRAAADSSGLAAARPRPFGTPLTS